MRLFIISTIVFLYSAVSMAQNNTDKPKANEIGFAKHFAEDYLASHGINVGGFDFSLEEYTDRLFFFNDMRANTFILIAREKYEDLLNDRVLAFSVGVPHSKARDTETFMHLYSYYDTLISDMASGKLPKEDKKQVPSLRISPMLYTIRWTQLRLKGKCVGQKEDVLYGCGPVAIAQLMRYYEWPQKTTGSFNFTDKSNQTQNVNIDGIPIEWSKIPNLILWDIHRTKETDRLMEIVGKSVNANYGYKWTSSNTHDFKKALTEHFGYSPGMFLVDKRTDESTIIKLIREDLKAGKPCILSGGHHVFVCDGAYEDFLHINMGWGGSYDGWYRFPIVRTSTSNYSFFDTALLNIVPLQDGGLTKNVTVETPGTLSTMLTEEECAGISNLTVRGRLNGADIRIIRRMAGAVESCDLFSWKGILSSLDIRDAEIVSDTIPFVCSDSRYYDYCKRTTKDNIETMMFAQCENLKHLYLPTNTLRIGYSAFAGCQNLKEITMPSMSMGTYSGANIYHRASTFDDSSLEKVRVCSDSPFLKQKEEVEADKKLFERWPQSLTMETDDTLETYAAARKKYLERHGLTDVTTSPEAETQKKKQKKTSEHDLSAYPYGSKVISRYKMVKGKKVLISRKVVPVEQ